MAASTLFSNLSLAGRLISLSAFLGHAASIETPFNKFIQVCVAIFQPLVSAQVLIVQREARHGT